MKDKPPLYPLEPRPFSQGDTVYTIWKGKIQKGTAIDVSSASEGWKASVEWESGEETYDLASDLHTDKEYVEYIFNYNKEYWERYK